jgi:energy-coupling factor transport system ATP-binding protein
MAGRPGLAVLDEPTSQLDPVAGDELLSLLRRLNEQWDTAILLADHRLDRALPAADRVVALAGGAVAFDGAPPEFLAWAAGAAPELLPPAAQLFAEAGLRPLPAGVKPARAALRAHGLLDDAGVSPPAAGRAPPPRRRGGAPALRFRGAWHEFSGGAAALRGVDLEIATGERVALMGRNGAGKSTLLRVARGLLAPTRGRVALGGPMALLLQHPGDYFLRDRIGDDAPPEVLERAGLADQADRHPRDLSGGERQRLALALVAAGAGDGDPAVVGLDEPTRGMDRARRDALAAELRDLADRGAAAVVATHDAELAAAFATRVVLLGDGTVAADGPPAEVLAGGWYFSTETARVLGGAAGALRPEQGAALLRDRLSLTEVTT